MNLTEALSQSAGLPITDLQVRVINANQQLFSGGQGDKAWTRADLTVQDPTSGVQSECKWWNPTFPNPMALVGQMVTISSRANSKGQWFGAKTDVWQKMQNGQPVGNPVVRVSVDGDHLSAAGATVPSPAAPPAPVFNPPTVDVNADLRAQAVPSQLAAVPVHRTTDLELEKRMVVWAADFRLAEATPEQVTSWVSTLAISHTKGNLPLEEIGLPGQDDEFAEYD